MSMTISKPTGAVQGNVGAFVSKAMADNSLDDKAKGCIQAALRCVGVQSHGKEYGDVDYVKWQVGNPDTCSKQLGLNCWTAVLFWAFQGKAIDGAWLCEYSVALGIAKPGGDPAMNPVMYSWLRANQVDEIQPDAKPAAGRLIFFGDPQWTRPMNHVVLSLGDGYVVSHQSLIVGVTGNTFDAIAALNPSISKDDLAAKRLTHISTIRLIADMDSKASIRVSKAPFWDLPRLAWM